MDQYLGSGPAVGLPNPAYATATLLPFDVPVASQRDVKCCSSAYFKEVRRSPAGLFACVATIRYAANATAEPGRPGHACVAMAASG